VKAWLATSSAVAAGIVTGSAVIGLAYLELVHWAWRRRRS
jgi:hypothetical protein